MDGGVIGDLFVFSFSVRLPHLANENARTISCFI